MRSIIAIALMLSAYGSEATLPMFSEQECARSLDTLGVYYNASLSLFIITIAADDVPTTSNLCPRSVRVERLNITRDTVKTVQDAVARREFHPDAIKYTYATRLDLKTAKVIVVTDAPSKVLGPLRRQFGDVLVVRPTRHALDINDVYDQRQFLRGYSVPSAPPL